MEKKYFVNGQARGAVLHCFLVYVVVKIAQPNARTLYVFDAVCRLPDAILTTEKESKQEHNMIISESFVTY